MCVPKPTGSVWRGSTALAAICWCALLAPVIGCGDSAGADADSSVPKVDGSVPPSELSVPRPDSGPPVDPSPPPFSLAFLPDTQYYTHYYPAILQTQTEWIRDHAKQESIAFLLQGGDLTDTNDPKEWAQASASIGILDGVLPYALAVGNHDTGLGGSTGTRDTSLFEATFPVDRYQKLPTFGGVFEPASMVNCYHYFEAGGIKWLVLVLEFGPRESVLAWASTIVGSHPDRRVIVLTHTYLYYDESLHGSKPTHLWSPHSYPFYHKVGDASDGVEIWNQLIRPHPNISFVLNGHILGDGAGRLVSVGEKGNHVYQVLSNFQFLPGGGNGWLRLMRFSPGARSVSFETYSPLLSRYDFSSQQQFSYDDLELFSTVDRTPPALKAVQAVDSTSQLVVDFTETVDPATAQATSSYAIDLGVKVTGALLQPNGKTVVLTTTPMARNVAYHLSVRNVADRATTPNLIDAGRATREFTVRSVLLQEDFSKGGLDGWTVVDDAILQPQLLAEWSLSAPSDWQVKDQQLQQLSNIFSGTIATVANRKGTLAYWNASAAELWRDYTLELTITPKDNDGVGVLLRYRDQQNYYKLEMDSERSFRKLILVKDGQESVLAEENEGYQPGASLKLKATVAGDVLSVALDGKALFGGPVTNTQGGAKAGTIALYCWGEEGVAFDDVLVSANP
jgi:hypothetical protein